MSAGRNPRIGVFDHLSPNRGGGQLVAARMAGALSRVWDVDFIHDATGYRLASLGESFGIDVSKVRERVVRDVPGSFAIPGERRMTAYLRTGLAFDRALTEPYDVFVYSGHGVPPFCYARSGLVYQHFPVEAHPLEAVASLPEWRTRHPLTRSAKAFAYEYLWRRRMRDYREIFVNSRFTAAWVERLWRSSATVLYPPVAIDALPLPKQNLVVSLGRFDGKDRKNLRAQVEAFSRFLEASGGGWSLCMMGFCGATPEDEAQVESLRRLAAGLPVTMLPNAPREVMVARLSAAKLFWHTRGLARPDGSEIPARFQEHFGIATVEAMMAGCVPLVPAAGGQPEVVEDGVSGLLCRDLDAMVARSIELAGDPSGLSRMSEQARARGATFHASVFDRRITDAVTTLLGSFPDVAVPAA